MAKSKPRKTPYKTCSLPYAIHRTTKRPLMVATGTGICFHTTNRVTITKLNTEPGEEMTEVTVAEVWPADRDVDLFDGALLVHAYNNFESTFKALQESQAELKRLAKLKSPQTRWPKDQAFEDEKRPNPRLIKQNAIALQRAYTVHLPIKV